MRLPSVFAYAFMFLVSTVSVASYAQSKKPAPGTSTGPIDWRGVTAEAWHLRENLRQRGYALQVQCTQDWSKALGELKDSDVGFARNSLDVGIAVDGQRILGWKGASGLFRLKEHSKEFGTDNDTAAQVYSNIDAPSRSWLYEMWFQQSILRDKVRLKFGKIDANTEFDVVQTAADFLNSSMGFSPTIVAFPTYPEPRLGFGLFVQPDKYGAKFGIFQTAGMGTMFLLEPNHSWSLGKDELPGRVSIGYWRLDGEVETLGGQNIRSTEGFYTVFEQGIWRGGLAHHAGERTVSSFLQFGQADGSFNIITHHFGEGIVMQAPFSCRPQDSWGAAATWVHFSAQPVAGFEHGAELILETYYRISITGHISLLQDFQFLHHPGGLRANPDGPVITPRLTVSF